MDDRRLMVDRGLYTADGRQWMVNGKWLTMDGR